jgi:primosomal protein N' (replication factor Y)
MSRPSPGGLFDEITDSPPPGAHTITVAFASGVDATFTYAVPDALWPVAPGQRVTAPFGRGNKPQTGFCIACDPSLEPASQGKRFQIKAITKVLDAAPLIDEQLLSLAQWISDYYVCPLGQVLTAVVPGAVKQGAGTHQERYAYLTDSPSEIEPPVRGQKQQAILSALRAAGATAEDAAIPVPALCRDIDCTAAPFKRLQERGLIRLVQKTTLKALPALPRGMVPDDPPHIVLNTEQQAAVRHVHRKLQAGGFGVTVLYGVTDSGKTEVYIRAIEKTLEAGKSAIVLLPEIALTAQTVNRFENRFDQVAVMHSGLTGPQRHTQWRLIREGKARVVVGARSAVFAPVPNLGLIVVDEEHEPSYKQDTIPRYHGRDLAVKRAHLACAHCILGSATPSLESLTNCTGKKEYDLVRLTRRVKALAPPVMKLVDLKDDPTTRGGRFLISEILVDHLTQALARGEQAMLLLNRRGYSNFVFCPACKHSLRCRNCDVTLTFHRASTPHADMTTVLGRHLQKGYAVCHYCLSQTLVPKACPLCNGHFAMIGLGSQRLEDELAQRFPRARVARLDSDAVAGKDYLPILRDFAAGELDILAGTQMLAKGLHFPNVTLVGIISADTSLAIPDFRANERTFQLIAQVAGRAGRSEKGGAVIVQTFLPDQPAIRYARDNAFEAFVKEEVKHRHACNLPPFWRLSTVTLRDPQYEKLEKAAAALRERIDGIVAAQDLNFKVRGPLPAPISRIQRQHRIQIILQAPNPHTMQCLFRSLRAHRPIRPHVQIVYDIDPVHVL